MPVSEATKTYQYVMTADECQLFNLLRRLEDDAIDIFTIHNDPRLKQKLNLLINAEGRMIGSYEVDPAHIIQEFARVGIQCLPQLLVETPTMENSNWLMPTSPGNDVVDADKCEYRDDRDSISDTRAVTDEDSTQLNSHQHLTWEVVRNEVIPASVKEVCFLVDEKTLGSSLEQDLKDQFPGIKVSSSVHALNSPAKADLPTREHPRGVKTMTIEMDDVECTKDPDLEQRIREQYPWAAVTCGADTTISLEEVTQDDQQASCQVKNADPFEHLRDLAGYAIETPSTQELECYEPKILEGWSGLEPARKMDVAHARAIQAHYGEVVDGGGCGPCLERGYNCKAYGQVFRDLAVTQLGHACQNCRLRDVTCDLGPPTPRVTPPPTARHHTDLQVDTGIADPVLVTESMLTPSSIATNKPSVTSRTSTGDTESRVGSVMGVSRIEEDHGSKTESRSPSVMGSTMSAPSSAILSLAESIGLNLSPHFGKTICSMYAQLHRDREVRPYVARLYKLQDYYSNLITLYTLVYKQGEFDLAYIVLLRFQKTNYSKIGSLPVIELALNAFKHLPTDSPLCKWFTILYSFLWGTQADGHYQEFTQDHPDLDPLALAKLLYAVAYVRDPFIEGHDAAVLSRWCDVHDHEEGSEDHRFCESMQVGLKLSREEAVRKDEERLLAEAKERVVRYGSQRPDNRADSIRPSPSINGKRKAESSLARPTKKSKRGAHGVSR
ncbi:hypothetical protein FB567DRAFT_176492 [Paraphoma chrysanthemicola]|uniref:Uncharacterized protein n=1 Tax=Paraphoma chrysanthemicola TaxID=798071 RepID=A0A8K0RFC2_9PLEO|nr:hypothetical protein FB567DRAFT_176492 [Paraphoma chrysanthemicola]